MNPILDSIKLQIHQIYGEETLRQSTSYEQSMKFNPIQRLNFYKFVLEYGHIQPNIGDKPTKYE